MGRSGGKNKKSNSSTLSRARNNLGERDIHVPPFRRAARVRKVLDSLPHEVVVDDPTRALALVYHEALKNSQINANGRHVPFIKTTTDPEWIAANGTDQVDIASLDFDSLPEDIKASNLRDVYATLVEKRDNTRPLPGPRMKEEERVLIPIQEILKKQSEILIEEIKNDLESGPDLKYYDSTSDYQKKFALDPGKEDLFEPYLPEDFIPRYQQILDEADKDVKDAQRRVSKAQDFASKSKAIADHARWAATKTDQSPEEIVKDIVTNPSKYESRIPEIVHDRFDDSWAKVSAAAVQEIVNPEEADQAAQKYIQAEKDHLDRTKLARDMKREAIREVPDKMIERAEAELKGAQHEKNMANLAHDEAAAIADYAKWEASETGKSSESVIDSIQADPASYKAGIPKIAAHFDEHTNSSWQATINGAKDVISRNPGSSLKKYAAEQQQKESKARLKLRQRKEEKNLIIHATHGSLDE